MSNARYAWMPGLTLERARGPQGDPTPQGSGQRQAAVTGLIPGPDEASGGGGR